MSATYDLAKDEIFGVFKTMWDADTPSVTPDQSIPMVRYEGVSAPDDPDPSLPWAMVTLRHVGGRQASFPDPLGKSIYERTGIVTVSVFSPLALGMSLGYELVRIAKSAYEGKTTTHGVWFKNVRINEAGLDGPWYMWNVVSEFEYDEIV